MLVRALGMARSFRTAVPCGRLGGVGVAYVGGLFSYGSLLREGQTAASSYTSWRWTNVGRATSGRTTWGLAPGAAAAGAAGQPKKTVEGALGGVAATVLIAALGAAGCGRGCPRHGGLWGVACWRCRNGGRLGRSGRSSAPRG